MYNTEVGSSAERLCLLEIMRLLRPWTHYSCGYLHKLAQDCPCPHFVIRREGTHETPTLMGIYEVSKSKKGISEMSVRGRGDTREGNGDMLKKCPNSVYTCLNLSKNKTKFLETCDCQADHILSGWEIQISFLQNQWLCEWWQKTPEACWVAFSWQSKQRWQHTQREMCVTSGWFSSSWHWQPSVKQVTCTVE